MFKKIRPYAWFMGLSLAGLIATMVLAYGVKAILKLF